MFLSFLLPLVARVTNYCTVSNELFTTIKAMLLASFGIYDFNVFLGSNGFALPASSSLLFTTAFVLFAF